MLTIVALGEAMPQGSFKAVVSRSTGRPMLKKANEKPQNEWRANVRDETRKVMDGRDPMEGPVVLTIVFTRPALATAPKRKPTWPCKKPDWDKLARAVSDGLKDGGAYRDDAQVVRAVVVKHYPVTGEARLPVYLGDETHVMSRVWEPGSTWDVLNVPGVVIRLAHLTEFPGIRKQLADAGFEPKDIPGGS
jgi:Holliday junction resolvase RusA-like endonuclease